MNADAIRHLATCKSCRSTPCYARNPVFCVMCGKYLNNDAGYSGFIMCETAEKNEELVAFRKSVHMNHVPVCLDCHDIFEDPVSLDNILEPPEVKFRRIMEEFKWRIRGH